MPAKPRISQAVLHLEPGDKPREAFVAAKAGKASVHDNPQETTFIALDKVDLMGNWQQHGDWPAGAMIYYASQPLRTPSRPLSDDDFKTMLDDVRESVNSSARATETFKDQIQRAVATMVASNLEIQTELKALRELKQDHRIIFIASLGSDALRLRGALPVELYLQEESVVAHAPDLEEFGEGETEYEALQNLRASVVEAYEFLKANEGKLGAAPAAQLGRLRDLIEERR